MKDKAKLRLMYGIVFLLAVIVVMLLWILFTHQSIANRSDGDIIFQLGG